MNPALRALKPYPMAELQARKAAVIASGKKVYDFGTGDPIEPTPTFIINALKASVPTISQYPSVAGTPQLRQAVSAYLKRRFGSDINPDTQILPAAGSKEAIFHLPLAFLDANSQKNIVIYGTPGYPVYQAGALFSGGNEFPVQLTPANGYRLELQNINTDILERTAIVWINYPHNPTGACVEKSYYKEQLAICNKYNIILASDECYQDMWFGSTTPPPSLLEVGYSGALVFHSCSKRSGMTGYRSGFIAGDPTLIASYRRWRAAMGVGSPAFIEMAAAAAWSDDQHAQERRKAFSEKYKLLADGLAKKGITVLPSQAGLYVWAKVPHELSADNYAARCLEAGIVISPGGFFGPGAENCFRLAVVPSLADCEAALAIWPSN